MRFIAGGTGFVGGHLIEALLERGHKLKLLVHKRNSHAADGIDEVEGDVTSRETFERAVAGCDAAINLVGIIRSSRHGELHSNACMSRLLQTCWMRPQGRYPALPADVCLGTGPSASRQDVRAEELVPNRADWSITRLRPSLRLHGPKDAFITMLAGQLGLGPFMPVIGERRASRLQPN